MCVSYSSLPSSRSRRGVERAADERRTRVSTRRAHAPSSTRSDILEGVHDDAANQITLHTKDSGCKMTESVDVTGTLVPAKCVSPVLPFLLVERLPPSVSLSFLVA